MAVIGNETIVFNLFVRVSSLVFACVLSSHVWFISYEHTPIPESVENIPGTCKIEVKVFLVSLNNVAAVTLSFCFRDAQTNEIVAIRNMIEAQEDKE